MNLLHGIRCALLIVAAAIAFTRAADRPNIVFIITDHQAMATRAIPAIRS